MGRKIQFLNENKIENNLYFEKIMRNLKEDNFLGRVFVGCSDLRPIDGYFACIDVIRPILKKADFKSLITGFYINIGNNDLNAVRFSFFIKDKKDVEKIAKIFENESNVNLIRYDRASEEKFSDTYGGTEINFRRFLHIYTQIGLDLLEYDVLYSRRLVAEYRLTVSPQRISCRSHFEPAFIRHSRYFKKLDSASVEQLWKDLDFWYPGGDWAHMLVNMLLPGDWIYMNKGLTNFFLNPNKKPPITGTQKEALLKIFNLAVSDNRTS